MRKLDEIHYAAEMITFETKVADQEQKIVAAQAEGKVVIKKC
jgi:hypothetical protein